MYGNSGIELTIKNIFIDYFRKYSVNNLQIIFKTDIKIDNQVLANISEHQISNVVTDLLNNNNSYDVYSLLHAQFNNNIVIGIQETTNSYFKEKSIYDRTIITIYINLIKSAYQNRDQMDEMNSIINKTLILPLSNDKVFINSKEFIDKLLYEIVNNPNYNTQNILKPLIKFLDNLNISQPSELVNLIDLTVSKSKRILNDDETNQSVKYVTLKDDNIKSQVQLIKDNYEHTIKAQQIEILAEQQLNPKTNVEDILKTESIYVNNIGLVLFHPFIPTFFKQLNLLNTDGEFLNIDAQYRAVHLLQLLISDATYNEHELVLNKILCNLEINEVIPMEIEFTEKEKALVIELMGVVLQRWEKMNNATIGHFRAAFLMRDGRLKLKTDGWYLNVEKRGYDIILSTIPWAFGAVKFKWMHKFLYTEWT